MARLLESGRLPWTEDWSEIAIGVQLRKNKLLVFVELVSPSTSMQVRATVEGASHSEKSPNDSCRPAQIQVGPSDSMFHDSRGSRSVKSAVWSRLTFMAT